MAGFSLKGVRLAYGPDRPVLDGLDLEGRPGEVLGFLGPNGAGKTTTFRVLAGLLRPDAGEVQVAGIAVDAFPREVRRLSAYVPDEPMLYPALSALENLNLFGLLWGVPKDLARTRAEALVREVGLWPARHQWVQSYSRGMRQKLALCAALLHAPKVLLMDEPFTGLDIDGVVWARALLRSFTAGGGSVLLTTHTPELVDALADRVAILRDGRVAYEADREALHRDGGTLAVYARVAGHGRAVA